MAARSVSGLHGSFLALGRQVEEAFTLFEELNREIQSSLTSEHLSQNP